MNFWQYAVGKDRFREDSAQFLRCESFLGEYCVGGVIVAKESKKKGTQRQRSRTVEFIYLMEA
jgi:hypothetical protein